MVCWTGIYLVGVVISGWCGLGIPGRMDKEEDQKRGL